MAQPVNIKVYTFCYNSEQILPFIINYWKQYATSVVVYDNMSTDKSVEILSKYDWIEVRHFDTNKKHDPDKMMQIKNNCVNESKSSKADYVMICDLDEVLYCYDSLMHDLTIAKQNGIKVFNSVYYNAIVNKFPASSQTLLQNISGVKLVKNINVNKVLLFDPSINIKFSNLQNNCTYDNNIKTGEINIIHNKMIGLDRFLNEQLDYIKRINKTNKYAMTYGASKNSCVAIFNNIYAKSFQPLYKAINQRIVLNNCKLPVQKTESKQVQTSNIIPETKNSTFNFTDINWKPAKIQYNTPACGNKDLVVVIPVYKADLDKYEQMSLQRLSQVIKTSFDIVLVMPEGLNIESYNNIYPGKINTLALNKQYFCNRKGYSYLCETTQFYECFSDYKFMLIYQLDGWIFKNDLNRFIKMDYDYIGAPWKQSLAIPRTVGNGGVSLRKISKFIEICKWLDPKDINEKYAAQIEDIFFCLYVKKKLKDKFNIAPVNVGLDFCIDKNPTYWMSESKGKLPMCVHAFQKRYNYWEDKFNAAKNVNVKKSEVKTLENTNQTNINFVNTANVNDDTLLVSMTSYPARIKYAVIAFKSILKQKVNRKCHCILVLAEPEFPNKSKNLPAELNELIQKGLIEIIWYPKNIMSHKKLMPTLKKYPNNDILIIDDDIEREQGWLQTFINDNRKHPSDIICGTFFWYYQPDFTMKRFDDAKGVNCGGKNNITDIVFNFSRPANGAGGVLYPKHTFKDPRFFDENLYQKYSPMSDESWQFMFNMIENRTLRQLSILYDQSKYVIGDSQRMNTALYKKNKYNEINERLFKAFPEYKDAILKRMNNIIVSVTSYKNRLPYLKDVLLSILNGTMKPYKIVITLCQEDVKYITDELQSIIDKNNIEILIAEKDIKPHKKYYYVMKKYPSNPIVTIDDDIVYTPDLIESLYKSYVNYPNAISARRTHKIIWDIHGNVLPYKKWIFEQKTVTEKSFELFATTGAGTLFPPGILNVDSIKMEDIDKCINADDVFLKYIANNRNVKVVWVKNTKMMGLKELKQSEVQENALYKTNCHGGNDYYLKLFKIEKK